MTAARESNGRPIKQLVTGVETSEGAGVRLKRLIGSPRLSMLDPFLLLDEFRSDDPNDYIAGFPSHPHRGFETVTYLLAGRMRHRDNAGHAGLLESGGVQWMTAGRGVVHSEMPEQEEGRLAGLQLWVNLPAGHKMDAPRYQEFGPDSIPIEERKGGVILRVIAGETRRGTKGPVSEMVTPVIYLDVTLPGGSAFSERLPPEYNAFVYLLEGAISVGRSPVAAYEMAVLNTEEPLEVEAETESRFLMVAGRPLDEPVARYGPFVMNTEDELRQAVSDFREGRF